MDLAKANLKVYSRSDSEVILWSKSESNDIHKPDKSDSLKMENTKTESSKVSKNSADGQGIILLIISIRTPIGSFH